MTCVDSQSKSSSWKANKRMRGWLDQRKTEKEEGNEGRKGRRDKGRKEGKEEGGGRKKMISFGSIGKIQI